MSWQRRTLALVGTLLVSATAYGGELLVNGSFETGTYKAESGYGVGYWYGDPGIYATAENGITPADGQRMFRAYDIGHGQSSDVWQLIDLTAFRLYIATGSQSIQLSALCNRVAGSEHTNTNFEITIHAYDGAPSGFPSQTPLLSATSVLVTDALPATWEPLVVDMVLPSDTTWIAAGWHWACNRQPLVFEGHYVDAVSVPSIPEPASLTVLALFGVPFLRRSAARGPSTDC